MPYPGIPADKTAKVDSCIKQVMADPKFKPKDPKMSKKSAATAVCISRIKGEMVGGQKLHSLIDILTFQEGDKLPKEIRLLPVGKFHTERYGLLEITKKHIAEMVKNFGIRAGVPIDTRHDAGAANGWFDKLFEKADGLWASVDWTELGVENLKKRLYRFISPEFSLAYVDPETGEEYGAVLIAAGLTNRPLFKELEALVAEELDRGLTTYGKGVVILFMEMELDEIRKKKLEDCSDEEKELLKKHASDLTVEERAAFDLETKDEKEAREKKEKEEEEAEAEEKKKKEAAEVKAKEEKKKKEKEIKTFAEKEGLQLVDKEYLKAIEVKADKGHEASEEIRSMKAEEEAESMIFSESNKDGKFAPKAKEDLKNFLLSLDEKAKVAFLKIIASLPKIDVFKEIGGGGGETLTASEELVKLVNEKIKGSEGKVGYSQALKEVQVERPDLAEAHADSVEKVESK